MPIDDHDPDDLLNYDEVVDRITQILTYGFDPKSLEKLYNEIADDEIQYLEDGFFVVTNPEKTQQTPAKIIQKGKITLKDTKDEQNSMKDIVVYTMKKAGFNVTNVIESTSDRGDIEVEADDDVLYLELNQGIVCWRDFTHLTKIAPLNKPHELLKAFQELLPLRGEQLQEWIDQRQMDSR